MSTTATTPLRAYHGDPAVKTKFQTRLADHRRQERLIQGTGWDKIDDGFKGCAVGCTLEKYDHALYPIELGLPEWLARLEDHLFERLPQGEAEQFAEDFLAAIPVGADIEPVKHRLAIARIEQSLLRLRPNREPYANECRNALTLVKAWHEAVLGGDFSDSAWSAAESAAESAARSAAESAARSAESAAWSARSAAWSAAWSAAESAAESAAQREYYRWEAATLLDLLRAA